MSLRALFVGGGGGGGLRAPWRLVVFAVATLVAGMIVAGLVYPVVAATPLVALARNWRLPLDQFGMVLALVAGTYAALRLGDGAGRAGGAAWARVGLGRAALGWRPLAVGLLAGGLAILVPSAILLATGALQIERQPENESWAAAARAAVFLLTPAALIEELAIRGYLLTTLRDAWRAPAAVAVTSVAFALLHLFNPGPTIVSTAVVALAGVFLATVRLATDSLYAAWLAHLAWNLVQSAILHAPVSGLLLPTPGYRLASTGPEWLTGGSWGPEGGLAAAAGMLVASFLLVWRLQATNTRERPGPRPAARDTPSRRDQEKT